MSHNSEEVKINFTGTAILSFVIVLLLLLLMANWHGPFKGYNALTKTQQTQEK